MLLDYNGDLKIADFGLATIFFHKGNRRLSTNVCGSAPYVAPEVISLIPLILLSHYAYKLEGIFG